MSFSASRRRCLLAASLLPLIRPARAAGQQVVIVGGGWGGLAAAAELRRIAPALSVVLIDRQAAFASFVASNRWLIDAAAGEDIRRHDYARIAAAHGYRFMQAEVLGIDAKAQRLATSVGDVPYDWLIMAPGIRENFAAWGLSDPSAVNALKSRFSGGMLHPFELPALKARLARFSGGHLLMNIPPLPYRCPPAPYERAMLIAWWLQQRKITGKLILVDPNPLMPAFRDSLLKRFSAQVVYLEHTHIHRVDVDKQTVETDMDDIAFDEALLSPPQQAAGLLWQAGLIRHDPRDGQPDGWGGQGALDFRSQREPQIFIIGDAAGLVSPLFGAYPKTGHVARGMGQIVAHAIVALARGESPVTRLPESICHVVTDPDPLDMLRIEADFNQRGDGVLVQTVRQTRAVIPSGADEAWAAALARDLLLN